MGSAKRPSDPPATEQAGGPGSGAGVLAAAGLGGPAGPTPPQAVLELAAACVRFVAAAVTVEPDFSRETLPLVDHYLAEARTSVRQRPETLALVTNALGAYFGEVVRRIHPSWWRLDGDDPLEWRVELRDVFLSFAPMQLVAAALTRPERSGFEAADDDGLAGGPAAAGGEHGAPDPGLQIAPEDRGAVTRRLDDLPPVPDDEYYALSTRLEVIDIAVDAICANLLAEPERRCSYRPEDYR